MTHACKTISPQTISCKTISSPVGPLRLYADDRGLIAILFQNESPDDFNVSLANEKPDHPVLRETERQLQAYFAGKLKTFSLPLDARGTDFQQQVWDALQTIPYGETRSYAQIARQIGRPKATRAVGAANGRNPLPIVVPCHRVIGANGTLTGFSGGLTAKTRLLALEGTH
jgi:methylated-DNA-[protein]-cysteine S-methyltransferase